MKKFPVFFAALVSISLLSCNDSEKELASSLPDVSRYKMVGMQIPTETGARWIKTYNDQYNSKGRTEGILYSVSRAELQGLVSSVNELIGVAFQYGFDELGNKHIILIPVDQTMRLWNNIEGRVYIDANSGTPISKGEAELWAQNFRNANPSSIWFHYFGRNVFDEIMTLSEFSDLNIMPAIDDLDMSPELLIVIGSPLNLLGRTEEETIVYDASYPCPKCDVQ